MRIFLLILLGSSFVLAQTPTPPTTPGPTSLQEESAEPKQQPPKKLPTAKTQDEYAAYQKAAKQPDLIAAEKLATDFASRFPESELREPLFQTLMLRLQSTNNAERAFANAEKVLLIDPQNVVALVTAANILSERTLPTVADAEQRFEQSIRYAERAIQGIDDSLELPSDTPLEQSAAFKNSLLALAHSSEGNVYLLQKNYAEAEKHLEMASSLSPAPDAVVLYRLSLAQHGQRRFNDALVNIDKAITAANQSHDLVLLDRAKQEKSTLVKVAARP
jgi:tetratricopeptide (TPR) repeat protein